ncbi:FAD-dependent oxidoreductase [Sphingobium algorifonticola]|uniref:FAD-binding domain-containing protein n=1 Tax=Sphingobium algorifonticola TaxID=2008318 RepID=A0A437JD09_9SPHN|nr:FAD-dependent monooxygenase [Sphingobium algorifonticola]RVT43806.1 hypothetical protein ENE74_04210 [Sphingobium algorifonticola]
MIEQIPAVIAGAGPVGLSIALDLSRRGIRSVVLERKQRLDPHSRATLLVPRSLQYFERLGVLDKLLAAGQRNDAIRILRATDHRPLFTFDFGMLADRTSTPFALALSQDKTERILLDAARTTGLVEVAFDTPFERFEQHREKVLVAAGGGIAFETGVLVGADGAHSSVRAQLGWELEGKTYRTRAVLADIRVSPESDIADGWLADPKAASFTIAIRFSKGVWRIIESAVPETATDAALPERARDLANAIFGPDAWRETLWVASYRKHERRSAQFVQGRVVLAGDSAHLNSPAGGQGMNAGLADAELLSNQIAQMLDDPSRAVAFLAHYGNERMGAFDHDIRGLTDKLEAMETMPAWFRNLVFSAAGIARAMGVETYVARRLSMLSQ